MDIVTRERLRNEVKVLAYRRILSKKRARELRSMAGKTWGDDPERNRWAMRASSAAYALDYKSGITTRYTNVAYGLLKGHEYKQIENKTRNPLNAKRLLETIHNFCTWQEKRDWTEDRVSKELLA
jgi:hypothetical protein